MAAHLEPVIQQASDGSSVVQTWSVGESLDGIGPAVGFILRESRNQAPVQFRGFLAIALGLAFQLAASWAPASSNCGRPVTVENLNRRAQLLCLLDPADVYGPGYPSKTFRVIKSRAINDFGEYRTRRLAIDAFDSLPTDSVRCTVQHPRAAV